MASFAELQAAAREQWTAWVNPPRPQLRVGLTTCGKAAGALDTYAALNEAIVEQAAGVDLVRTACLGLCYSEPNVTVVFPDGTAVLHGPVRPANVPDLLQAIRGGRPLERLAVAALSGATTEIEPVDSLDIWKIQVRRLMERCGLQDPESIDHYLATGGYEGLVRALGMKAEEIIQETLDSGLWGRGGAAFPTGRKWDFLRTARGEPKFLVCNADEGDPGAFVNRTLMEGDPHGIIEGMIIAARATGAIRGYIYIRDEYPLDVYRMERAVEQARERGLLGENILGSGTSLDLVVVRGAGSYLCGEETGLISSIQDSRGMPRIRPPFPAQSGLFHKPTNVNNVESYANVPLILRHGVAWYREQGTQRNAGTKMFSLSGRLQRVCVVEVPFGFNTLELLNVAGGGPLPGHQFKGLQSGGPLGGLLPASEISIPLEPEPYRERDVLMGSGGLIALDDTNCIVDLCQWVEWFAEDESCSRCTTCRIGTQRLVEILRRFQSGEGRVSDLERIPLLADTLRWSNCVHGQAAPTAVRNALRYFREELLDHIQRKRCEAGVCRGLIRFEVSPAHARDREVEGAAAACPVDAFRQSEQGWRIDQAACIRCGVCHEVAHEGVRKLAAFPETLPAGTAATPPGQVAAAAGR